MNGWSQGISSHCQVIEDASGVAVELSQRGGGGLWMGADEADGEAAQPGGVFRAVTGSDAAPNHE